MAEIEGKKISGVPERTELTGNELYPFADSGSQGHVKGSVLKGYCATPIGEVEGTAFDGARGKAVEDVVDNIKGNKRNMVVTDVYFNDIYGKDVKNLRIDYVVPMNGAEGHRDVKFTIATTSWAGLMSAEDKQKLDSINDNSDIFVIERYEEYKISDIENAINNKKKIYWKYGASYSPIIQQYKSDSSLYLYALESSGTDYAIGHGSVNNFSICQLSFEDNGYPNTNYIGKILFSGKGTKFLSDDGEYKKIDLSSKQDALISGTNIKTINGQSVLGSGDITIEVPEGGITDAPSDGSTYGRNNGAWIKVEMPDVSEFITETEADGKYATPALVDSKVAALVNSAPTTLDTLKELADALGNDANFSTTITTKLREKVDKTTYESDKAGFATKTELANKLDTSTYNSDKSGFATKTELNNKKNITIVQEVADASSSASFNLDPNTLKKMGEVGTITVLGFTTTGLQSNELAEYAFEFKSGDTPTVLTMPESVKWIGDHTIEANKTYQVSIVNNLAVMGGA